MAREAMEYDVRDRRRRPGRAVGGDPPQAARGRAQPRGLRLRAREGLGGRRAHPVRRGDRSDRPQRADPRLEGEGRAARDAGDRRPVPVAEPRPGAFRFPNFADAAADEQPRQLHRQPGQRLPLARPAGRGAGRRDLSGLCRRRGALRRGRLGEGRRHRRHGRRQGRQAQGQLHRRAWSCMPSTR